MKSSFGRSFFTAAAILLVAMTILGASFQIKVNQFLTDTTVSGLQQNADTIAELAAAYFNNGGMYNRSFQLNLTVAGIRRRRRGLRQRGERGALLRRSLRL